MKKLIMKKWVAALRSGDYKQGAGQLRDGNRFCCLGVLCNLHAQTHPEIAAEQEDEEAYLGEIEFLPSEVIEWSKMNCDSGKFYEDGVMEELSYLNDHGSSFEEIADIIEKNYRKL